MKQKDDKACSYVKIIFNDPENQKNLPQKLREIEKQRK